LSKKHGAKKHRSRKARRRTLCASCRQPASLDPPGLLASLAASLNACEEAGIKVVLRGYGAVLTKRGYVLRMPGRQWAARTLSYTPFEVAPADDELDEAGVGMDA
jgi:hypothetical protein